MLVLFKNIFTFLSDRSINLRHGERLWSYVCENDSFRVQFSVLGKQFDQLLYLFRISFPMEAKAVPNVCVIFLSAVWFGPRCYRCPCLSGQEFPRPRGPATIRTQTAEIHRRRPNRPGHSHLGDWFLWLLRSDSRKQMSSRTGNLV